MKPGITLEAQLEEAKLALRHLECFLCHSALDYGGITRREHRDRAQAIVHTLEKLIQWRMHGHMTPGDAYDPDHQ